MSVATKKKQGTPKKVLPHRSEPLKVYSLKLPSSAQQFLDDLSQDASDTLGWTVSSSTLLRVMLTYIQHQPSSWVAKQLHPLIEEEIAQGRVWGTKGKKERKTVSPTREFKRKSDPHPFEARKGRKGRGH